MTYLHAASFHSAQGGADQTLAALAAPKAASVRQFSFLNQPQSVAYFAAFEQERLRESALLDLLDAAIRQAVAAAGWPSETVSQAAILLGSTSYILSDYEASLLDGTERAYEFSMTQLADGLQARYGNRQIYSLATSCTSSAHALMQADALLRGGLAEYALVVGFESYNLMTLAHFHGLGLLADECRPFAGNGLVLGEGVACLALSMERPTGGGLQLLSAAANTDPNGVAETSSASMAEVMRQALAAVAGARDAVQLVKAHAVGSAGSDAAEAAALAEVFERALPVLCCKPAIGHTLGAAGALETTLLYRALQVGALPAGVVGEAALPLPAGLYLSNFFGFGGNNVSLLWAWRHG